MYIVTLKFQNFLGLQFTFSTKVERISGYISTNCSNRGNLCLASMESSFIAFNRQTVIVSGKFFWHSLERFRDSLSVQSIKKNIITVLAHINRRTEYKPIYENES